MRKQLPKLFGILAAAACIFGVVLVTPTLSPMPTASAAPLPNGYDVSCTPNGGNVICVVTGCPRVYEDYAGDVVHIKINGGPQEELGKACGDPLTYTVNIPPDQGFNFAMQGCRKYTLSSDECGPFSDYKFAAVAKEPINCPAGSKSPTVIPPALCEAAPVVKVACPAGSPTPEAATLGDCAAAPPKICPPGSAASEVPFGGECTGPTNAVVLSVTQQGLGANVTVTNNSALPANCAYTATKTGGLIGPGSVNRDVSVGPNSTGTIDGLLWPPIGSTYRATVNCTATYDGKQVSIGESTQNVG